MKNKGTIRGLPGGRGTPAKPAGKFSKLTSDSIDSSATPAKRLDLNDI